MKLLYVLLAFYLAATAMDCKEFDVYSAPIDFVAIVDVSGSMWGSRITTAKAALNKVVQTLRLTQKIDTFSVFSYSSSGWAGHGLSLPFTQSPGTATSFVNNLPVDGATYSYYAMDKAAAAIRNAAGQPWGQLAGRDKVVVYLTDGEDHDRNSSKASAKALCNLGWPVYPVSVVSGGSHFPEIVTHCNTRAYTQIKETELLGIFQAIIDTARICCPSGSSITADRTCAIHDGYRCRGQETAGTITCSMNDDNDVIACKPGYTCKASGTSVTMTPCGHGYASGAGATSCYKCSANTYPTSNGAYASSGATGCTICPAGYRCDGTNNKSLCTGPSYSHSGSTVCTVCYPGSYLTVNTNREQTNCTACTAGTYTSGAPGINGCTACPAGSYNLSFGSTSCTICPAGHRCPTTTTSPITCTGGTYQDETGQTICKNATEGYYVKTVNSLNIGQIECELGHECTGGRRMTCTGAAYADRTGMSACNYCPIGSYVASKSVAGSVVNTTCTPCTSGTYGATAGITACAPCAPGTFNPMTGQAACTPCGTLTYASAAGQTECHRCDAYEQSAALTGDEVCTSQGTNVADYGKKYVVLNRTACTQCTDSNEFSNPGCTQCVRCQPGEFFHNTCQTCPAGTYSDGTFSKCLTCPANSTLVSNTHCTPNAGYYHDVFITEAAHVRPCKRGHTCAGGEARPVPCARGHYQPERAATTCNVCETGYTTMGVIGDDNDDKEGPLVVFDVGARACAPCTEGHQCPIVHQSPQPCYAGTYSPGGKVTACTDCPASYYNTAPMSAQCWRCIEIDQRIAASSTECRYCGKMEVEGTTYESYLSTADSAKTCNPCKFEDNDLFYCLRNEDAEGKYFHTRESCPPGSYRPTPFSCRVCTEDETCLGGGNTPTWEFKFSTKLGTRSGTIVVSCIAAVSTVVGVSVIVYVYKVAVMLRKRPASVAKEFANALVI